MIKQNHFFKFLSLLLLTTCIFSNASSFVFADDTLGENWQYYLDNWTVVSVSGSGSNDEVYSAIYNYINSYGSSVVSGSKKGLQVFVKALIKAGYTLDDLSGHICYTTSPYLRFVYDDTALIILDNAIQFMIENYELEESTFKQIYSGNLIYLGNVDNVTDDYCLPYRVTKYTTTLSNTVNGTDYIVNYGSPVRYTSSLLDGKATAGGDNWPLYYYVNSNGTTYQRFVRCFTVNNSNVVGSCFSVVGTINSTSGSGSVVNLAHGTVKQGSNQSTIRGLEGNGEVVIAYCEDQQEYRIGTLTRYFGNSGWIYKFDLTLSLPSIMFTQDNNQSNVTIDYNHDSDYNVQPDVPKPSVPDTQNPTPVVITPRTKDKNPTTSNPNVNVINDIDNFYYEYNENNTYVTVNEPVLPDNPDNPGNTPAITPNNPNAGGSQGTDTIGGGGSSDNPLNSDGTINFPNFDFNLPNINWSIDGLSEKFPFSIPFDLIAMFEVLNAEPQTPELNATIDLKVVTWDIDWDLHRFDSVAELLRNLEFIAFCVALILITRKLIKG